jgi:hypothetical protein
VPLFLIGHSVQELVVLARDPSSKLSYGSPGVGNAVFSGQSSSSVLVQLAAGELFKTRAGINLTHVPYRGAGHPMKLHSTR